MPRTRRTEADLKEAVAAYCRERNIALIEGLDATIAFARKHGADKRYEARFGKPISRESAEIAFHKSRTAIRTLPMEFRRLSKQWLIERGYAPHDDGDV